VSAILPLITQRDVEQTDDGRTRDRLFVAWHFGITAADRDDPSVHLLLIVGVGLR
jgi:hypothetical protein